MDIIIVMCSTGGYRVRCWTDFARQCNESDYLCVYAVRRRWKNLCQVSSHWYIDRREFGRRDVTCFFPSWMSWTECTVGSVHCPPYLCTPNTIFILLNLVFIFFNFACKSLLRCWCRWCNLSFSGRTISNRFVCNRYFFLFSSTVCLCFLLWRCMTFCVCHVCRSGIITNSVTCASIVRHTERWHDVSVRDTFIYLELDAYTWQTLLSIHTHEYVVVNAGSIHVTWLHPLSRRQNEKKYIIPCAELTFYWPTTRPVQIF